MTARRRLSLTSAALLAAIAAVSCGEPAPPIPIDPLPAQLVADPDNPSWFERHDEGPFFLCGPGDPEGFLYRGERLPDGTRKGDQAELIEKLAATGANSIYLMAVRSHGGDGDDTENPFIDSDPQSGLSEAILEQWESWFRMMDEQRIVIYFFFYDDSARIWDTGDDLGEEERAFVSALVDRFKRHRHLVWVLAEEYEERFSARKMRRLAAHVRDRDRHGHPIAVHKLDGLGFREFADDPSIDQFAIQYNKDSAEALHQGLLEAWGAARGRYNLNLSETLDWGSGAEARGKAWAAAMAGAYVMVLGMEIADTPLADLEACGHLVRFFESTDFPAMEPLDRLAAGDTRYVLGREAVESGVSGGPGVSYILYAGPGAGALGLEVALTGTFDLRWLDAESGRVIDETGVVLDGNMEFARPRPPGLEGDVALYLRSSGAIPQSASSRSAQP